MNRGIHSRGYLPHWDFKNSVQGITFRLFDSVPKDVILKWKRELEKIENENPVSAAGRVAGSDADFYLYERA